MIPEPEHVVRATSESSRCLHFIWVKSKAHTLQGQSRTRVAEMQCPGYQLKKLPVELLATFKRYIQM